MLYQLSYPAVGGRIIEKCPGFVKIEFVAHVLCLSEDLSRTHYARRNHDL